jgi:hypothetical protein
MGEGRVLVAVCGADVCVPLAHVASATTASVESRYVRPTTIRQSKLERVDECRKLIEPGLRPNCRCFLANNRRDLDHHWDKLTGLLKGR